MMFRFLALTIALSVSLFLLPVSDAQIIKRAINGEPLSIDPHGVFDDAGNAISYDLFEGLITYSAAGEAIPGVAKNWTISDDGLTYTFNLRKDAKWSDGEAVTAEDFVFAWQRLADPQTAALFASLLYAVENAEEITQGKKDKNALGVRAFDEHTFEVKLTTPTSYFLKQVGHYSLFPVPQHVVENNSEGWTRVDTIVSNGAFKLAERRRGQYLDLVPNPHFHDAENVALEGIRYIVSADPQLEVLRFRSGDLDITYESPSTQVSWLSKRYPEEQRIAPRLAVTFLFPNLDDEAMSDVRVRQALTMTLERDIIAGRIARGGEQAIYGMVPPSLWSKPAYSPTWKDLSREEREAEAQDLMQAAGYSEDNPLTIEIVYATNEDDKRLLVAATAMWKPIYVRTRLINVEPRATADYRRRRAFQISRAGWVADYDHPYNFLELFKSNAGGLNFPNYQNSEFDRLLDEAASAPVLEAERLYAEAEKILMQDEAVIPIYLDVSRPLVRRTISGWQDNPLNVHLARWMDVRLED